MINFSYLALCLTLSVCAAVSYKLFVLRKNAKKPDETDYTISQQSQFGGFILEIVLHTPTGKINVKRDRYTTREAVDRVKESECFYKLQSLISFNRPPEKWVWVLTHHVEEVGYRAHEFLVPININVLPDICFEKRARNG